MRRLMPLGQDLVILCDSPRLVMFLRNRLPQGIDGEVADRYNKTIADTVDH